jgi:hypothetical protein
VLCARSGAQSARQSARQAEAGRRRRSAAVSACLLSSLTWAARFNPCRTTLEPTAKSSPLSAAPSPSASSSSSSSAAAGATITSRTLMGRCDTHRATQVN